ncbi:MAG: hypothetical protein CL458_08050 [Acidimicrobiaceae bacterium]|nr:hypothetical protein [Acidimicrobiaceae bacterium]|tara:strand:- start:11659 stop:12144 length:486 start_codon:yes stop_codon:yes gene_type:complete
MAPAPERQEAGPLIYVCVDYEAGDNPQGLDPCTLVEEIFSDNGADLIDHELPVVAAFDDPSIAMEAAVVGQWRVQREINDPNRKLRIGVHLGSLVEALAVLGCSNGNQIIFSGAVDVATGGALDARLMGQAQLWVDSEPTQLWLSTDSRPDIDGRPLRIPT